VSYEVLNGGSVALGWAAAATSNIPGLALTRTPPSGGAPTTLAITTDAVGVGVVREGTVSITVTCTSGCSGSFVDTFDLTVRGYELAVNEVGLDTRDYVELRNDSPLSVAIGGWTLVSTGGSTVTHTLPSMSLAAGALLRVNEGSGTSTGTTVYTGQSFDWADGGPGALGLVDNDGVGVDFVRWGTSVTSPPAGTVWQGASVALPITASSSVNRIAGDIDTDSRFDWCRGPETPLAQNTCDNVVAVAAADAIAGEPSNNGRFLISRTAASPMALTVLFDLAGSAATAISDFTMTSYSQATIPAGQASVEVLVDVVDDGEVESQETVNLNLVPGAGYQIGAPSSATVYISDDDSGSPTVTVVATDPSAGEPANDGTITITRSQVSASALSVAFNLTGSTATATSDFTLTSYSLATIPSGQASVQLLVDVQDDGIQENQETVVLNLAAGAGYVVGGASSATVIIADDDGAGDLIFASDFEAGSPLQWSVAVGWAGGSVGLVGYWPFDLDSNDHSGNGNNGTWSGGGGLSSGRFGNAANFLVDQYYRITSSTTLRSFTALTVAAWFRPTASHNNEDLFGGGYDGGPSRYGLFILGNPAGGATFNLYNDSSVPGTVPNPTVPVANYLNNWHHFAATWDGASVHVYVDGLPTVSGTFAGPLNVQAARSLFINRHEWAGGAGFSSRLQGAIDDLAVFARALSPAEVVALASDTNANGVADFWDASPPTVMSSVYHLDEGAGTVASDAVGGHHGVVSGATWTAGHSGAALSFDAAGNSSVAVPRQIYDGLGNSVFAEAWIYPTGYSTAPHYAHIFAKRGAYNDWYLALTPEGLLCSGLAGEGGIGSQGVGTCSPSPIPLNQWSKVATSYDGTVMRLYVNGSLVDSEALALVLDWDAPDCPSDEYHTDGCYYGSWIGSNSVYSRTEVAPHNVFHGIIDEVRIGPSGP